MFVLAFDEEARLQKIKSIKKKIVLIVDTKPAAVSM